MTEKEKQIGVVIAILLILVAVWYYVKRKGTAGTNDYCYWATATGYTFNVIWVHYWDQISGEYIDQEIGTTATCIIGHLNVLLGTGHILQYQYDKMVQSVYSIAGGT